MSLLEALKAAQAGTREADEASYREVILRSQNPEPSDGAALAALVDRLGLAVERVERDVADVARLAGMEADLRELQEADAAYQKVESEHQKLRQEWRRLQAAFDASHAALRERLAAAQLASNRAFVKPSRLEAAEKRIAELRKARADLFG